MKSKIFYLNRSPSKFYFSSNKKKEKKNASFSSVSITSKNEQITIFGVIRESSNVNFKNDNGEKNIRLKIIVAM